MPTYVYYCEQCDSKFEAFQKFSEEPLRLCPEGHEAVRRVFTPAGIIFKGSGWYIKDSKTDGAGGTTASTNTPSSKSEPKSESKSESKSEGSSEAKSESTTPSKGESKSEAA